MRTARSTVALSLAFVLVSAPASATPTDALPSQSPAAPEETPTRRDPFATHLGDGRIVRGSTAHRMLHFTFDDGPSAHTERLLETLEAHRVHATFFLVARQLEREDGRRIARSIAAHGHTVGLHSLRHADMTTLDVGALRADFDRAEAIFTEVFEGQPVLFRPPYGRHSELVDIELATRGYTEVLWNLTANDTEARTADEVVTAFESSLDGLDRSPRTRGGVVVLHDSHPWVVDAMPRILANLEARNCALLADPEAELWDVTEDLEPWFEERAGAAATRWARPMRLDDESHEARQRALRATYGERCEHE